MRIVYLTQAYPPIISGASHFACRLANAMAAREHQVLVIAPSGDDRPLLAQDERLIVLRLSSLRNPLRVGQRFMVYPRRAVMKALQDFRPDILHSHDALQLSWLGFEYAHTAHIPLATTTHQLPWFVSDTLPDIPSLRKYVDSALWMYARWNLRHFTSVITPTYTIGSIVAARTGIQPQVISYGIDLTTFHPPLSPDREAATRLRLNIPPRVPIILHVGQLNDTKRVDRVIRAAARTMSATEAHLLIVGDGREKPGLIQLARGLGIEGRVHFPGYVTVEQGLPEIYRLASLFVTASEIETQGIVLLEAAASGLPIAAVRATCIPEIVHDGENGFLAEPGDLDSLAHAMTVLTRDDELAQRMGKASHALAQLHDQRTTMSLHEELYRDMLAMRLKIPVKENEPVFARLARWLS